MDAPAAFRAARVAVAAMRPASVAVDTAQARLDAAFRVVVFTDDVAVQVVPDGAGSSVVTVRSRSRVGRYDFGVNRRRVRDLLRRLTAAP